jgi:hypothetical protein
MVGYSENLKSEKKNTFLLSLKGSVLEDNNKALSREELQNT